MDCRIAPTRLLDDRALRARCAGPVVLPGDQGFEAASLPWSSDGGRLPALVAYPADADDVAAVIRAARDAGLRVVVAAAAIALFPGGQATA
jgi:FAD/FMN-containing dehydrogenase